MLGQALRTYRTQREEPKLPAPQHRFASHLAGPYATPRLKGAERPLQPSGSIALNASGNWPAPNDGSHKRKASELYEAGPSSQVSRSGESRGVLTKLHGGVFFDETDFVDDADINLDEDSPLQTSLPPVPPPKTTTTPTPKPPLFSSGQQPPLLRTSQIDWSSSPIDHLRAPGSHFEPPQQSPVQRNPVSVDEEPIRPAKRRQLPWQEKPRRPMSHATAVVRASDNGTAEEPTSTSVDPVEYPTLPQATPAGKAVYPWNKTASAVKEEQRKLRNQANQTKKSSTEAHPSLVVEDGIQNSSQMTSKTEKPVKVELSSEQQKVLQLITYSKKSVFFTGSAGTGKSVLMREIIQVLKKNFSREADRVAVTASTGLAACNIGGVTLHSFAGIGLGKEPVEVLVKRIKKSGKARQRWLRTKVLIVDEISMVDGELFDKLEEIARMIRNNGRPFGGIQLVITGDFFQLPPVADRGKAAKFTFEAATWSTSIQHTIGLTHIFRQKDPEFAGMLNEMRLGRLTARSIARFQSLKRTLTINDNIEPTELFPTRQEVDRANDNRMRALPGNAADFMAVDGGSMTDIARRTELLQNCMAPERLSLKLNAQVMLIKNIDETLVNGSIGKVVKFMDEKTYSYVNELSGDDAETAPSEFFGEEAARLKIRGMGYRNSNAVSAQKYPVVQFQLADGTTRELLLVREVWKVEQPNGEVIASRSQVPLIPAWALSIHKAQGQTLDRVRVDLGRIFEKGQAYVALSRATTQAGLQILRFDPNKVMAHEKVRKFYDSLASVVGPKQQGANPRAVRPSRPPIAADDSLFLDDYDDDAYADCGL